MNDKQKRIEELEKCLKKIQKITRDEFLKHPNVIADLITPVLNKKNGK